MLADYLIGEVSGGIKLHRWLIGAQGHLPTRLRIARPDARPHLAGGLAQDPVVVVAGISGRRRTPRAAVINITDCLPNRGGTTEVKRSSRDREDLTRWQEFVVDRRVEVGVDLQLLVQYVPRRGAREIPIAVVHHVDDGGAISGGGHRDVETALADGQLHLRDQCAGETLVTVGEFQTEAHRILLGVDDCPDITVEADRASVKVIEPLINRELMRRALELKATSANAIAESSARRTKVGGARFVRRNIRVTEHDVGDHTISIRHPHLQQPGAKVEHDRSCGTGRQLNALNGTAVRGDAIVVDGDGHEASLDMKESRPKGVETCGIG